MVGLAVGSGLRLEGLVVIAPRLVGLVVGLDSVFLLSIQLVPNMDLEVVVWLTMWRSLDDFDFGFAMPHVTYGRKASPFYTF